MGKSSPSCPGGGQWSGENEGQVNTLTEGLSMGPGVEDIVGRWVTGAMTAGGGSHKHCPAPIDMDLTPVRVQAAR